MKYYVNQIKDSDCGSACAKMFIAKYHKNIEYLTLPYAKNQVNLKELQIYIKKFHIETLGVSIQKISLIKELNFAIAQIIEGEYHHFVILKKTILKGKYVILYDPKIGKRILSFSEFINISTGYFLIYKNHQKIDKNRKKDYNYLIISCFVSSLVLDGGIVYFLTYLVNENLEIITLSLTLIIAFTNFILKIIFIIIYQEKLNCKLIINKNNIKKQQLLLVEKIKKYQTDFIFKGISYLFGICFLSMIILTNGALSFIMILVTIFLLSFKYLIFDNYLRLYSEKIRKIENLSSSITLSNYNKIKKVSLKILFFNIIFYTILIIFLIISSFVIGKLYNYDSFPYVIFLFFTCLSIYNLTNRLIDNYQIANQKRLYYLSIYNSLKDNNK